MADISDYDKFSYDYSKYWENRSYENSAEKHILNNIFYNKQGKWFLDIGGSYGRLASTYYDKYQNPVILDYSLKTLQKNREILKSKYPNIELIAANAYKMPFKDSSFDAALMVRVLHHIENPKSYFSELKRILTNDSTYVQEYANKIHIKAVTKALFKLDISIFSKDPYLQPKASNQEGSKGDQESIFYNYHPQYISQILKSLNFKIKKKYGCSFLRSPFIKKLVNENIMMFFEIIMQNTLSWSNISPSIILETRVNKTEGKTEEKLESLKDILSCPSCKTLLKFEDENTALCNKCSRSFFRKEQVWDLRVK